MRRSDAVVVALAGLLAAAAVPRGLAAQIIEPMARRPGIALPPQAMLQPDRFVPTAVRRTGTFPVVVIPALFQDSPEPHIDPAEVEAVLFGETGTTVRMYYQEASNGRLDVVGTVADWVRTDITLLDGAGSQDGHGLFGPRMREHFGQALAAADPGIDFRAFDNDGPDGVPDSGDDDGVVDAVAFEYLEIAGSCGGPGIWPHRWTLVGPDGTPGVATEDIGASGLPIRVAGYLAQSVTDCDGVEVQGPHTTAHEFGHVLGLPDFYVQAEGIESHLRHWTIGCFGLMGGGAWGCGSGVRTDDLGPSHFSPLARHWLGWLQFQEVGIVTDQEYVLDPVQTTEQALRVPLAPGSAEYFLIEYRPRLGFDTTLPDDGVLIYHYDASGLPVHRWTSSEPPPYYHHLVEADGDDGLRKVEARGGNRGVAGDMFGRAGVEDALSNLTTPSTRHHLGLPSTLVIHSIRVENGQARIRLSTTPRIDSAPISTPAQATALAPYEARIRLMGGTPPYEAVEPPDGFAMAGLSLRIENGDELVVAGSPTTAGFFLARLSAIDAAGNGWWQSLTLQVTDAELSDDVLLDALTLPAPVGLDEAGRGYLDSTGNDNGQVDVGDLRAYIQRTRLGGG